MLRISLALAAFLAAGIAAGPARSDPPRVVTDIAPVESLVVRVMQGVGAPVGLLPPGASPHGYALRPSQAAALEQADVVIWVGDALTPWLRDALVTLAGDAVTLELLEYGGGRLLSYRGGDEDHTTDATGQNDAGEDADPHAWLDPEAARAWVAAIASVLADADPDNAAVYAANAEVAGQEMDALTAEIRGRLAGLDGMRLILDHDALQYFEARFGLRAIGAMTLGDSAPSPRRLAELRAMAASVDQACVVLELGTDPGLGEAVAEGTAAKVVVVDLQGAALPVGPDYYPALLRGLAEALDGCR